MALPDKKLAQLLTEGEFLGPKELLDAQQLAERNEVSLAEALVEKDLISDENIGKISADALGLPFVSLAKVAIPKNVLFLIPESIAKSRKVIAFDANENVLKVATTGEDNKVLLAALAHKAAKKVKEYFATDRDLYEALRGYKKDLQQSFDDLLEIQIKSASAQVTGGPPIAKIVNLLIEYAYESKASDIHIEPNDDFTLVRFRVDGVLQDRLKLPIKLHDQVVSRVKVLSKLRTDEHLSAQDGKMQVKQDEDDIDIRVSIIPIVKGEKIVLRILSAHSRQFGLSDLGMKQADLLKVKEAIGKPYGMVISTGPTGSGKSTTMYSILKILNTRAKNIATIEDPVEYEIEGINQVQVNVRTNLTFADGLKSLLRQDPDIIYVGEIRDTETASIAVNSATTGHLVVSTLHTNDAATTFPRLIDMEVEPFLIASTLNAVIAQRLVRKICERCKVSYLEKASNLEKIVSLELVTPYLSSKKELRLYKGKGCQVCHDTGYVGRVGIFEVLPITPAIQVMINQKADSSMIAAEAKKEGMTTMLEDGIGKVQQGITTLDEILKATKQ